MRKRVHIALAGLVLAVVGVVGWQMLPPREPVYNGKSLTGWLKQYMANHWSVVGANSALDMQAQSAIQQIGTNAIPTLLRMLRAEDSTLKHKLMQLLGGEHIVITGVNAQRQNWTATAGFEVLGAKAESAVPALVEIVNWNTSPISQASAIRALGSIGPPAKEVVSSLLPWTTNANLDVRFSSIYALAEIGAEPDRVVPVLIKALQEPDIDVQTKALSALEKFGPDAKPAVPALTKLLKQDDIGNLWFRADRVLVTNALKAIDPEAAARAGVR